MIYVNNKIRLSPQVLSSSVLMPQIPRGKAIIQHSGAMLEQVTSMQKGPLGLLGG